MAEGAEVTADRAGAEAVEPSEGGLDELYVRHVPAGMCLAYEMNADGSGVTRLTDDSSHEWSPAWSPDGTRIAFESDRDGRVGIYVMNADGTEVSRLIDTREEACCPAWQPVRAVGRTPPPGG